MTTSDAFRIFTIYKKLCQQKNVEIKFTLEDFINSDIELKTKKDINSINIGNDQDIATYFED